MPRCVALSFVLWLVCATAAQGTLYLSCERDNDLFQVLRDNDVSCRRFASPVEAVAQAPGRAGVLTLAQGYPLSATDLAPAVLDEALRKRLRLYVEFPGDVSGMDIGRIQTQSTPSDLM